MAKRKIIVIDEDLCNGCGECITACAEGALKLVDGKAKLVREQFCDGFGDCIGECPTGALKIVEKDVPDYDPAATRVHVARTGGNEALRKFDDAARRHGEAGPAPRGHGEAGPAPRSHGEAGLAPRSLGEGGCPGSRMRMAHPGAPAAAATPTAGDGLPPHVNASELRQWPIQIHLVQPGAPFFRGKELVVMNTCGPLASADVHWRFLRGRSVVVGCPKLDDTAPYAEKLGAILSEPSIPKVLVVRMQVPCCGGLTAIVEEAVAQSGRSDLAAEEVTLSLDGDVLGVRPL
jgi:Pyruvate/2-oxoacid:ferredoxin oxidoreductase delta subunit